MGQQQWMARAWPTTVVLNLPTAQALPAEVAATPDRRLLLPPGLGLATFAHLEPFQRRMRVVSSVLVAEKPTAQALLVEVAVTPLRRVLFPACAGGLGTCIHVVPFQCRMRA